MGISEATTISATPAADNPRGNIVVNTLLFAGKALLSIEVIRTESAFAKRRVRAEAPSGFLIFQRIA